jgi:hypothetical protein
MPEQLGFAFSSAAPPLETDGLDHDTEREKRRRPKKARIDPTALSECKQGDVVEVVIVAGRRERVMVNWVYSGGAGANVGTLKLDAPEDAEETEHFHGNTSLPDLPVARVVRLR